MRDITCMCILLVNHSSNEVFLGEIFIKTARVHGSEDSGVVTAPVGKFCDPYSHQGSQLEQIVEVSYVL